MTGKSAAGGQRAARYVSAAGRAALTPAYDLAVRLTVRERVFRERLVTQTLAGLDIGDVLDVGCGTGTLALALAGRAPQVSVTGVDGDPSVLESVRRRDTDAHVAWTQGDATMLPFRDQRFDRVVASLLLHHLSDHHKLRALR